MFQRSSSIENGDFLPARAPADTGSDSATGRPPGPRPQIPSARCCKSAVPTGPLASDSHACNIAHCFAESTGQPDLSRTRTPSFAFQNVIWRGLPAIYAEIRALHALSGSKLSKGAWLGDHYLGDMLGRVKRSVDRGDEVGGRRIAAQDSNFQLSCILFFTT
jgi:hypothetical protein